MLLIGLHGKAGVGKDTAADYLCAQWRLTRYALANPIRRGLVSMLADFGVTEELLESREKKEQAIEAFGKSPRELMQTLGTEWGCELVHPRLWLMVADRLVEYCKRQHIAALVITDVRFEDEAEWVRSHGGEVWHITRQGAGNVNAHVSESGLPEHLIDLVIPNDGTIDDLTLQLDAAMQSVLVSRKTKEESQ